jgi:hypothetical protein
MIDTTRLNVHKLKNKIQFLHHPRLHEETPEKVVEEEEQQKPESTKAEDEPEIMEIDSSPKCAPPKREMKPPPKPELDEKQKQALENAYKFPGGPSILVHPHPKAKSGKFDCTVMSLSVLLDYRTEDNKESTFEVSLFAELFNEMLMRDSGFKLYRAVVEEAEKPKVVAADNAAKEDIKESDGDTNSSEPTNKKEEETKSEAADTKKKIVTKDKDLLLACSYFDLGHCGYFETKDLEDIFTTMNLNLSRAQIKKLVAKVTVGKDQQVNYRTFTDKPEDQDINVMTNDIEKLGHGFRAHVPFQEVDDSSTSSSNEGLCSYRGSVVDVSKLLAQLTRSEKARSDTESHLKISTKSVRDLKEASDKYTSIKEKLQAEVKDLKKQLKRVEDDMKRSQTDSSKYYAILKDIHAKVHPAVNAPTSPVPDKEVLKKEELNEGGFEEPVNGKKEMLEDVKGE